LVLVGDVTGEAKGVVTGVGKFAGGRTCRVAVDVGEHDRRTGSGERTRGVQPHAGGHAGDEATWPLKS
jgi:hypothetical protein